MAKKASKSADIEAMAMAMFGDALTAALDAKLANVRGDAYAQAGRNDSTRTRLDALAETVEYESGRIDQLRAELTAALARISALENSGGTGHQTDKENAATAKPGSDSAVLAPTADDKPAPGYRIVRSSAAIDRAKVKRWRWARCVSVPSNWYGPSIVPGSFELHWNRGDADCEVPAVPFKSSADRLPRVGDVVEFPKMDATRYEVTAISHEIVTKRQNGTMHGMVANFQWETWNAGRLTIISEGPDPHVCNAYDNQAAVIAEREKAAWNAAIDAADAELDRWSWYPGSEERRGIRALRK